MTPKPQKVSARPNWVLRNSYENEPVRNTAIVFIFLLLILAVTSAIEIVRINDYLSHRRRCRFIDKNPVHVSSKVVDIEIVHGNSGVGSSGGRGIGLSFRFEVSNIHYYPTVEYLDLDGGFHRYKTVFSKKCELGEIFDFTFAGENPTVGMLDYERSFSYLPGTIHLLTVINVVLLTVVYWTGTLLREQIVCRRDEKPKSIEETECSALPIGQNVSHVKRQRSPPSKKQTTKNRSPLTVADGGTPVVIPNPTRPVSTGARLRILFDDSGAGGALFGRFFACVALAMFCLFVNEISISFHDFVMEAGGWRETGRTGTLVSSEPLSSPFYQEVYRHEFSVKTDSGEPMTGVCYSRGQLKEKGTLVLEESKRDDGVFRIYGTRFSLMSVGSIVFFLLIMSGFTLVGIVIGFGMMPANGRRVGLLRRGIAAEGKIVNREEIRAVKTNSSVTKITVVFTAADGERKEFVRRMTGVSSITDQRPEILFYDPLYQKKPLLWRELPKGIRFDPNRGFVGGILPVIPAIFLTTLFTAEVVIFLLSFLGACV